MPRAPRVAPETASRSRPRRPAGRRARRPDTATDPAERCPHRVCTRRHARSSSRPRILLRHQRSSPRGSLGTSHNSSHSGPLATGFGASARYASSARTLREGGSATGRPRRDSRNGPSMWISSGAPPRWTAARRVPPETPMLPIARRCPHAVRRRLCLDDRRIDKRGRKPSVVRFHARFHAGAHARFHVSAVESSYRAGWPRTTPAPWTRVDPWWDEPRPRIQRKERRSPALR